MTATNETPTPAPEPEVKKTGVRPISEWGSGCARGFVSNERFGSGPVIKRTNRAAQRKRQEKKPHG
jgi:hypothetical protein